MTQKLIQRLVSTLHNRAFVCGDHYLFLSHTQVLADDFLEGKIPVTDFIQKYKQLRKV